MPLLSVNLDDVADCRRAMQLIRQVLQAGDLAGELGGGCEPGGRAGRGPGQGQGCDQGQAKGRGSGKGPGKGRPGQELGQGVNQGLAAGDTAATDHVAGANTEMPLRKKLAIIKQRGVWRHLVAIARAGDTPKSLPEWDALLDLPRNKMRSLKAIFAKLENRWNVRFLRVAEDAGADESGNPRYIMPPRIRNQILSLAE